MSQTGTDQFLCEGCGRSYRWKPELAGKRVKCKCGQVMTAPELLAPAMAEVEVEEDLYALAGDKPKLKQRHKQMLPEGTEHCPACDAFLVIGARICVQCGYDLVTKKAPPKPTVHVDDGTAAIKEDAPPKSPIPRPVIHPPTPTKRATPKPGGDSAAKIRYLRFAAIAGGVIILIGVVVLVLR